MFSFVKSISKGLGSGWATYENTDSIVLSLLKMLLLPDT